MSALVAGIHVFTTSQCNEDVDGRNGAPRALARGDPDKPGHDAEHVALFEPALDPIVAGVMQRKQRIASLALYIKDLCWLTCVSAHIGAKGLSGALANPPPVIEKGR